jgi:AAA domain
MNLSPITGTNPSLSHPFTTSGAVFDADAARVLRNARGDPMAASDGLAQLDALVLAHPKVRSVYTQLLRATEAGSGSQLILLLAPPGAGKSWVAGEVVSKLCEQGRSEPDAVAACAVPAVMVETTQVGDRDFSFKELFSKIARAVYEPPLPSRRPAPSPHELVVLGSRGTTCRQREAAVTGLRLKGTRLLALDEAAHMLNVGRTDKLLRHAQTLKSLANDSKTVLLLVCSYDGLPLLNIDTQLRRRMKVVHLARYRDDDPEDVKTYRSILLSIGKVIGLDPDELDCRRELLMQRTVGCAGATMDVLRRALADGMVEGIFDYDAIDRELPSKAYAAEVRKEALAAELALKEL